MARSFDGSSSPWMSLSYAGAVISGTPFSFACWANLTNLSAEYAFFNISDGTDSVFFRLTIRTTGNIRAYANGGAIAASTTTASAGTWIHVCGVWTSSTSRAVYLNGGGKGTNATSATPSGLNLFQISRRAVSTPAFAGHIAEAGLWSVALSDADVLQLSTGVTPVLVKPQSLLACWPIYGRMSPEIDIKGRFDLTVNNAPPASAHCRTYNRCSPLQVIVPPPASQDTPELYGRPFGVVGQSQMSQLLAQ